VVSPGDFGRIVSTTDKIRFAKRRRRTCWLDSRFQKYASKGSLIARTFAIVKFGYARVSTLEQNLDLQVESS
jgi:hypothetical protein